jgi:hypothetical protein
MLPRIPVPRVYINFDRPVGRISSPASGGQPRADSLGRTASGGLRKARSEVSGHQVVVDSVPVLGPLLLPLLFAGASPGAGDAGEETLVRRGHVVCLDQELRPLTPSLSHTEDEEACNEPDTARFAFNTAGGEHLLFLEDDPLALMFLDPEVRAKELLVEGWPRPEGRLELLHVYALEDGKPYLLHYRCDRCNITASGPGPCWCCGEPFELREVPAEGVAADPGGHLAPGGAP